jgi:hypothetical protein
MKCLCRFSLLWPALAILLVFSMSGCGDNLPKRVPVSGHVSIDGKPLETGSLFIQTPGQRSSYAKIGPGGKFSVTTFTENDGLMPGKHQVAVICKEDPNSTTIKWLVPKKYSNILTSGLEFEITGSTNDLKIDIKPEPGEKYPVIEKVSN